VTLLAEIALVVLAAVGVTVCLALVPRGVSARRKRISPPPVSRPEQLLSLERLVTMSRASALQVHAYLRPVLAEIASRRLAARGRALERMSDREGTRLLGDRLWDIVRPTRPFPIDRDAGGVSPQELAAMLETLERL
jgi:hypothetical protein